MQAGALATTGPYACIRHPLYFGSILIMFGFAALGFDPLSLADQLGLTGRVEWRAYVPDDELEHLYNSARVFAFLSDYEGFAMTPLEALTHGAAPVLLDTAVAREVYGPAARLVQPDVDEIAGAIIDLLTDEPARAMLVSEGRRLMDRYSWTEAASRVLDAIERAV